MKLLALETAYDICGAAVLVDGAVVAVREERAPRRQNELLGLQVAAALQEAGLDVRDLDAVAVSSGPGSYMGLRIGMSYAKGLALGGDLAVIPAPTLAVLAHGQPAELQWVAAWSHRDLFYAARRNAGGLEPVQSVSGAELDALAGRDGLLAYLPEDRKALLSVPLSDTCPSAEKVGIFVLAKGLAPVADMAALVPDYFQNFQVRSSHHDDS